MAQNFRLPLDYKEKVGRAVHNLSLEKRFTLHPMTLIPAYGRQMKRGEKFIFSTPQMLLQSIPTVSPVMGRWRLRVEWYFNSYANHYGWIDNNSRLTPQEVMNRRHHTMMPYLSTARSTGNGNEYIRLNDNYPGLQGVLETFKSGKPLTSSQYYSMVSYLGTKRGGLSDFMGVPAGYISDVDSRNSVNYDKHYNSSFGNVWNLDFILTYLNIVRCYHINQQFPDIPYIQDGLGDGYGDGTGNQAYFNAFNTFSQKELDDLFMLLRFQENGVNFVANGHYDSPEVRNEPEVPERYQVAYDKFLLYLSSVTRNHGGLFCCQYMPDLFRNLLPNDQELLKSNVSVNEDGSFSISTFRFQNRLQMIYDRINPFGGKDSTVSRTRWGVTSKREYDIPELICVDEEYIDTTAITSYSSGSGEFNGERVDSVPGELSGNVNQRKFPKGKQSFTADTPGMLMAVVSLVPVVDYCQGIDRSLLLNYFEDEFSPQMAQRGFDDVPLSDYLGLPVGSFRLSESNSASSGVVFSFASTNYGNVVGKQVAWLSDMTAVNRVHGEFARGGYYETWVLTRNYLQQTNDREFDVSISPYGNPLEWQYPFIAQNITDPNWFIQIAFNIKSVSPVGYRFMPTLE